MPAKRPSANPRLSGIAPLLTGLALMLMAFIIVFNVVQKQSNQALHAEVTADIAAVRATDAVANLVVTLTILKMRASQVTGASAIRYIVVDPQTGERISGNIHNWPKGVTYSDTGPSAFPPLEPGQHSLVGAVTSIESTFPLFIARERRLSAFVIYPVAIGFATFYAVIIALLMIIQRRRMRRLEARIGQSLQVMSEFAAGDRRRRIADNANDDLGKVARGIDALLSEVEERLTGQDVIAERIAHELRSPIAHAAARISEWTTGHPAKAVDEACSVINGLLDMIEAVLFITDLHQRELKKTVFRLDHLIADLCHLFEQTATERHVSLKSSCEPVFISAERPLLERMLANLIDNAVHYTHEGGSVMITFLQYEDGGEITITDQGPGLIGMPRQPGVMLQRGSAGRHRKGTGLGLATAMRIADRHGLRMQMRDRTDTIGLVIAIGRLPIGDGHLLQNKAPTGP